MKKEILIFRVFFHIAAAFKNGADVCFTIVQLISDSESIYQKYCKNTMTS
ncbi:hypothetical protein [Methanobrevibacter sp.]